MLGVKVGSSVEGRSSVGGSVGGTAEGCIHSVARRDCKSNRSVGG